MKKLTVAVLVVMLLLITYAVVFCTPKYFILKVTAYCPCEICCGEWADGFTYTGAVAGYGCVAIDPNTRILKMGQRVYIEGYGYGVCNDIGGAIKGWEADVCFDTHQQALEWEIRMVKVYVLEVR